MHKCKFIFGFVLMFCISLSFAQTDSVNLNLETNPPDSAITEEEDYSQYVMADPTEKVWASPKIFDLSPQKLLYIGYDYVFGKQNLKPKTDINQIISSSQGLKFGCNIPIISRNKFTWLGSLNFTNHRFTNSANTDSGEFVRLNQVLNNSLSNTMVQSTMFKPLNEKRFILLQLQGDVSGDYAISNFGKYVSKTKFSGALLYGWRKNDRQQFGFGVSRTYRAGEVNHVPIIMYNYTSVSRKWGTEILFPARAAYRRTFNSRNLLLIGYELEGQSYFLGNFNASGNFNNYKKAELRRSEIRFKGTYETALFAKRFIWISIQAGVRYGYAMNVDNGDIVRGFTGKQAYLQENKLSTNPYLQITLTKVSP